jgi:S-formylglutathione hydrolase FrmB
LGQADPATLPDLHVSCGTGDPLLGGNHRFLDAATTAGVPVTGDFGLGVHDWACWDARIQDVLAWLPVAGR